MVVLCRVDGKGGKYLRILIVIQTRTHIRIRTMPRNGCCGGPTRNIGLSDHPENALARRSCLTAPGHGCPLPGCPARLAGSPLPVTN